MVRVIRNVTQSEIACDDFRNSKFHSCAVYPSRLLSIRSHQHCRCHWCHLCFSPILVQRSSAIWIEHKLKSVGESSNKSTHTRKKNRRLKRDQPLTIGTRQQLIHFKYMRLKKLQLPFNLPKGPHKRNRSQFFLFHNQVSIDSLFCCVSIFSNNGEWSLRKRSHTHTHNDNTCTY